MAEPRSKNLGEPDETVALPGVSQDQVELGDLTVGRVIHQPGWRWSTHIRPQVGGEWCQARHVGVVLSGRIGVVYPDGTTLECGPDDVYELPPGHDGYTIGHEPCVVLEWSGLRAFTGFQVGAAQRALATLLLVAIADSAAAATRLGEGAWREALSEYFEAVRGSLELFDGREEKTTSDGLLATFDGPAQALRCADAVRRRCAAGGLEVRGAVHLGEVELSDDEIRGKVVHEAAHLLERAEAGEILLSETTRALALSSGFELADRGTAEMPGDDEPWRLYTLPEDAP